MLTSQLHQLYQRELLVLEQELSKYEAESKLWQIAPGISNSAGHLCYHICGNLQHFIGAHLGNSAYVRNRDAEFTNPSVSRKELLALITQTQKDLTAGFAVLNDTRLNETYPLPFLGEQRTIGFMLMHLFGHLQYHIGQINYHRRLV